MPRSNVVYECDPWQKFKFKLVGLSSFVFIELEQCGKIMPYDYTEIGL